ncbi:MAG: hypothetical protein AAB706_02465 [Patescibacteria group bacterium]
MGNPDLIITVNKKAYLIKGTEYDNRNHAVQMAMLKHDEEQLEIDRLRHDPKTKILLPEADPSWFPEEIETIRIYWV